MIEPDILESLYAIRRCRKCACLSCERSGFENHAHHCTQGPDCINTREKLLKRESVWSTIAFRAIERIRGLTEQLKIAQCRIEQLENIHHG